MGSPKGNTCLLKIKIVKHVYLFFIIGVFEYSFINYKSAKNVFKNLYQFYYRKNVFQLLKYRKTVCFKFSPTPTVYIVSLK